MNPARQIAILEAELKSARTAAEQNAREDRRWHAKYLELREVVTDTIQRQNGQDPAIIILTNWMHEHEAGYIMRSVFGLKDEKTGLRAELEKCKAGAV